MKEFKKEIVLQHIVRTWKELTPEERKEIIKQETALARSMKWRKNQQGNMWLPIFGK